MSPCSVFLVFYTTNTPRWICSRAAVRFSAAVFCILLGGPARADDAKIYRFAGTTFPLIFETDANNEHQGLAVDILNRISEKTGFRFQTLHYPWSRAMAAVRAGGVDGLIGPYWSRERAKFLDYSTWPFYSDRMIFVAHSQANIPWNGDFHRLFGQRILAVQDWSYGPHFREAEKFLRVETVPSFDLGLGMLAAGRVDLLAANERNSLVVLHQQGLDKEMTILKPAFQETRGYFGFSKVKDDQAFQRAFNRALGELWKSGEIVTLNARYQLLP